MRVSIPNAATINRLNGSPFPHVVRFDLLAPEIHRAWVCPLRLRDIVDLLVPIAEKRVLVFDVATSNYDQKASTMLTLSDLARKNAVSFRVYEPDVIALMTSDLYELLRHINHYELKLIDLGDDPTPDQMLKLYCHYTQGVRSALLGDVSLPASKVFVHAHDDCYQYIETRDRSLLFKIVSRLIQIFAGTMLTHFLHSDTSSITPIESSVVEHLIAANNLTILPHQTTFDAPILNIPFSADRFDFRNSAARLPIAGILKYHLHSYIWTIEGTDTINMPATT